MFEPILMELLALFVKVQKDHHARMLVICGGGWEGGQIFWGGQGPAKFWEVGGKKFGELGGKNILG